MYTCFKNFCGRTTLLSVYTTILIKHCVRSSLYKFLTIIISRYNFLLLLSLSLVPLLFVSLEPTDSVITLGTTVSLQCSISLPDTLTATIQSLKWYKDSKLVTTGVDTMIAQGISTYDLDTVLSAEAGNYTCVMEITSPYIDNGVQLILSNATELTVLCKLPLDVT